MPHEFNNAENKAKAKYRLDIQKPDGTWKSFYSYLHYLRNHAQAKRKLLALAERFTPKVRYALLDNELIQLGAPYEACIVESWIDPNLATA